MAEALTPEERDALAAELALGLLVDDERAYALRLQLADASFRTEVERWEARFAALLALVPDVVPPDLWPALERRLGFDGSDATQAGGAGTVVTLSRRVAAWRIGALASGAVAAGLALLLVVRPTPQAPLPLPLPVETARQAIVAQLGASGDAAQLVVDYDPGKGELRIRPIALPPSALTPELWVIPAGGAPLSLGLVSAQDASTVAVPEALRALLQDGATLAVSLEEEEGAPHAAPSAAPIAVGTMHKI